MRRPLAARPQATGFRLPRRWDRPGLRLEALEDRTTPAGGFVSGVIYLDANNNGAFDAGSDALIPGLKVFLDADNDGVLDSGEVQTTSFDGNYFLSTSTDGAYHVAIEAADGFSMVGAAPAVSLVNGSFQSGVNVRVSRDSGGVIRGSVYYDVNENGTREAGEPTLTGSIRPSVYLELSGGGRVFASVGNDGTYTLVTPAADDTYSLAAEAGQPLEVTTALPVSVTVAGGELAGGRDIGVRATAGGLVSGSVFLDTNKNGTQDNGEGAPPAGSFFVYDDADLDGEFDTFNPFPTPPESGAQVAADGTYAFVRLTDGEAVIRLTDHQGSFPPFGRVFVQTTPSPATFDLSNGVVHPVTPFGARFVTGLRGMVFDDQNGDGQQNLDPVTFQPTEPGLAGVTVYADLGAANGVFDPGEPTAVTDATGSYLLDLGAAGNYTIRVVAPAGRVPTNTFSFPTSVQSDQVWSGPSFGLYAVAGVLTGTAFLDGNLNGSLDPGEAGGLFTGQVSVFAELAPGNGTLDPGERTAAVDATTGAFTLLIPAAAPGSYVVRVVPVPGTVPAAAVGPVAVSGGGTVSLTAPVPLTRTGGTVSGSVFVDANGNGLQDSAEFNTQLPVGTSVRVYADTNGNAQFDAGEPSVTATPSPFGGGTFFSLPLPADGAYTVRVDGPAGFAVTTPAAVPVLLRDGAFLSLNVGLRQSAGGTVRGTMFYDADGDGVRDPEEPGVAAAGYAYLDLNNTGANDIGEPLGLLFPDGSYTITSPPADGAYAVGLQFFGPAPTLTTTLPATVSVAGGGSASLDIGFTSTAGGVVTGSVFTDANRNGTRDAGEAPAGFVSVFDDANENGTLDTGEAATSTAADGTYALFKTTDGPVHLRTRDSGSNSFEATGTPPDPVTVSGGAVVAGPALGVIGRSAVSGTVFTDTDGDGQQDFDPVTFQPTEPALAGVTVYADLDGDGTFDAGEPSAVTTATGFFTINLPAAGSYAVRAVPAAGQVRTSPAVPVSVAAGQTANVSIGLLAGAGTVTGSVFFDVNENGSRDAAEGPGFGAQVYADLDGDGKLDAGEPVATVGNDGAYTLYVPPALAGTFTLQLARSPGVELTTPAPSVTVGGGTVAAAAIGFLPVGGSVQVAVFSDANGNGSYEPESDAIVTAPGLTGVTVYADIDGDSTLDSGEPTAAQFSYLALPADGTYTIRVVAPAGFAAAGPASASVTVAGGSFEFVALGLKLTLGGYLTGTMYYDANGNGARDAGEDGFGGTGVSVFVDANGNGSLSTGEFGAAPGAGGAITLATPPVDGSYVVRAAVPAFATVTDVTPARSSVTGGATVDVAVGVKALTGGLVRGTVFLDADHDGTRDPGEGPAGGGALYVFDDLDGDGLAAFSEPYAAVADDGSFAVLTGGDGTHHLRLTDRLFGSGFRRFALSTPAEVAVTLSGGEVKSGVEFGGTFVTAVRGSVFDDQNGNGVSDFVPFPGTSEPGLAGVTVYADLNGSGSPDPGEPTTVTDAFGNYELTLAAGGTVTVRAVPPAGRVATTVPTSTEVEDGFVGFAPGIGLAAAVGTISGTVFSDADGNGNQGGGEGGLAGLVVFGDANGNGTLDAGEPSATSAADGTYTILVFTAGDYTPRLAGLAGGTLTTTLPGAVTVSGGAATTGIDFGIQAAAAVMSVAPASVAEGDTGARDLVFTVTRSGNTATAVSVGYSTGGGTAVAGTDYAGGTGTVSFAVGQMTAEVRVPVLGNARLQANRTFTLALSAGAGVTLGTGTATGTITDDDAPATVTAVAGTTPQSATVNTAYGTALAVDVRNAAGALVEGVTVTFAAPSAGAGGTFGGAAAVVTGASGRAVAPALTANGTAGVFTATATATGGAGPQAAFSLTNTPVVAPNNAPTLTLGSAPSAVQPGVVPATVTVTVGDAETPAADLVVTVTPSAAGRFPFTVTGTGAARTITFTGNAAPAGSTTDFTVTVSDGSLTTSATFSVTVQPATAPPPAPLPRVVAVGSDAGGGTVTVYNPDGTVAFTATPFPGSTGGVRTATADFNGDGTPDVVAGTGPGSPARVVILDPASGQTLFSTDVFEGFLGGVFVAAGDLDGDGKPELVVTPDQGGGPRVLIFSGAGFEQLVSFFGIDDPAFRGGARAAVGDINHDGRPDLVVSAGFGGGPRVAGFDGRALAAGEQVKLFNDFFAFESTLRNGAYLTVGDLDGDGFGDLIAGAGPDGAPRILAFSGEDLVAGRGGESRVLANFFGGDVANRNGVRVTVKDLDGDARADLVVAPGTGTAGRVVAYLGRDITPNGTPPEFAGFDSLPGVLGGAFVG